MRHSRCSDDQHERGLEQVVVDREDARLAEQVGDLGGEAVGRDERGVAVERRDDVDAVDAEGGVADQRTQRRRAARAPRDGRAGAAARAIMNGSSTATVAFTSAPATTRRRGRRAASLPRDSVRLDARAIISEAVMIRSLWAPPSP